MERTVANIALVIVSTLATYASVEAVIYLMLCFGFALPVHPFYDYKAWSNPQFMRADTISGFRLNPRQPNDGLQIFHGMVEFYYRNVSGNAAGYYADHEYSRTKQKPYRMIVYGDSFTQMLYENGTWPDHLNKLYKESDTEVYNFSFNGGGLANWHSHYFNELAPHYEFDLVVFAICCGDLTRTFTVAETRTDGFYLNRFPRAPRDHADLAENFQPHLVYLIPMADREFLAKLYVHFANHSFLALPMNLYAMELALRVFTPREVARPSLSPHQLEVSTRTAMLGALVEDIRKRGKIVVIVSLPWLRTLKQEDDTELTEVQAIAQHWCTGFVNGYDLFRKLPAAEIATYWPPNNGHWYKRGADRFAELLAPELVRLRHSPRDC